MFFQLQPVKKCNRPVTLLSLNSREIPTERFQSCINEIVQGSLVLYFVSLNLLLAQLKWAWMEE